MANNNTKPTKGRAYTQPDYIKPKSKWTKKMTIATIVIVVIILFILALIGINQGWFKTADMINGKVELDDYSTIEIQSADVNVSDESVQSYIDGVASTFTTTETVEEGTVEDGDTVNIDYSGILEGEEEPFDGGTAEGQSLTLGSGTMVDGFESGIVGHSIGETFDINVTFPEDYSDENVAGKNATFTITINNKTITTTYDLTDEMVQEYSSENLDEQLNTVDELKEYYRTKTYDNNMQSAILSAMADKTKVIYYNEQNLADLTAYNENVLSYYGSSYGIDADTMAAMYGYDSAEDYAEEQSKSTLQTTMMLDKVAEDKGITVTQEELDAAYTTYMENEGYEGTLEEFVAESGNAFTFLVEKTEVLLPKVVEALKENVVIVETPEEETTEETAEETVDETAEETAAETAEETAAETAEETAAETVEETVAETAEETVAETAEETVAETAEETINETAEEAAETAEETAAETAEETAAETAEESAAETVEETTAAK